MKNRKEGYWSLALVAFSLWFFAPLGGETLRAETIDTNMNIEMSVFANVAPQTSKKKKKTATRKRTTSQKKKRTSSKAKKSTKINYRRSVNQPPKSKMKEENVLLGRIDSMMVGDGVDFVKIGEPLMVRFRAGDTLLTLRDFEVIYYGAGKTEARRQEARRLESQVDSLTSEARFADALLSLQKHMLSYPTHLPLLQRACNLAHHERSEDAKLYIWQMAELLNLIARSGDGKTAKTAYRVMSLEDALVFEHLWQDREARDVLSQQISLFEGKELLTLSLRNGEATPKKVYFVLPHKE